MCNVKKIMLFILVGISSISYAGDQNSSRNLNPLELAIDFEKGDKQAWTDFEEDGGLNKWSQWYGLPVASLNSQKGKDGLVEFLILGLNPYATVTIKQIRESISLYCGFSPDDWKVRDPQSDRKTYNASNDKCKTAEFDNWFLGKGIYGIRLGKKKY